MAWLLSCLSPAKERLLLNIFSEAGSGKTELAQAVRQLIDPSTHAESNKFDNAPDLCAAAKNQGVLYIGNLSGLEQWLSNVLCLLLTQGTFQTRSLYTDGGLYSVNLLLPVILTSLSNPVWAADLGSRTIPVESPPINSSERIGTDELHRRFTALRPGVFGALCLAAQAALAHPKPGVLEHRMQASIDFVASGVHRLGVTIGDLREALGSSKIALAETHLDASPVYEALRAYADECVQTDKDVVEISTADLLKALRRHHSGSQRLFPDRPNQLSQRITEILEPLRSVGITADKKRTSSFRGWVLDLTCYASTDDGQDDDQEGAEAELRVIELDEKREQLDRRRSELGLPAPMFEEGRP